MKGHPEIVPIFVGVWIVLGIVNVWLFYFDRNVARKKRLVPIFIVSAGVLFAGFVFLITGEPKVMLFVIPAVAIITLLNLRTIRVCESCGRTLQSAIPFWKPEYCSKCGAKLP